MNKLTNKQEDAYHYLIAYIRQTGRSPTIREISNNFDITTKACHDRLSALVTKGFIKTDGKPRGISLTKYNIKVELEKKE